MRLLPWAAEGGKPCYLNPDASGSAFVSTLADGIEATQLGRASELLDHVRAMLSAGEPTEAHWRQLVYSMSVALEDALRVAESRGERIPGPDEADEEVARVAQVVIDRVFVVPPMTTADATSVGRQK